MTDTAHGSAPAIELKGISKAFGPVQANKDISIRVMPGTIHGIIGENGAGKSTLMSILYGFYKADAGEIFIAGKKVEIPDSQAAIAAGIGMVTAWVTARGDESLVTSMVHALATELDRIGIDVARRAPWRERLERLAAARPGTRPSARSRRFTRRCSGWRRSGARTSSTRSAATRSPWWSWSRGRRREGSRWDRSWWPITAASRRSRRRSTGARAG